MQTDTAIRKWAPAKNQELHRCGDGLYLRGFLSGRKLFQIRVTVGGKRRWIDLGNYPDRSLADARETAMAAKRTLKSGEATPDKLQAALLRGTKSADLETQLVKGKDDDAGRLGIPTFGKAYRDWYALQLKANRWTNVASRRRPLRSYENHIEQHLGNLRLDTIRRPIIKKVLQPLFMTHTETASNLIGFIWEVMETAYDDELIESNACPRKASFAIPNRQTRHAASLHFSRLPEIWDWLDAAPFSLPVKTAMQLTIVTVHRASVIANMRWDHFDSKAHVWTIPVKDIEADQAGFMKSGRRYSIRLPHMLSEAVCALPRTSDFIFTLDGHKPINSETLRRNFQKFDRITTHGFRNSFKTWALNQEPAIDGFLVDRYCDHALAGLDKNYRRDDLFEQRAALAQRYFDFVRDED
jgi:integrase